MLKLYFNKTENWKEFDEAIEYANQKLKKVLHIDSGLIENFKAKEESFYETVLATTENGKENIKSISGLMIRAMGISHGGADYDGYGLLMDKDKTIETQKLLAEHDWRNSTIEIYGRQDKRIKYGLPRITVSLLHELGHFLAFKHKIKDTMHEDLNSGKTILEALDRIVSQIAPVEVPVEEAPKEVISTGLYKPRNFILQEWVSKPIFEKYGDRAWQFIDPRIIEIKDIIRDFYGVPMTMNNWHRGGEFQYRGFDEGGFRKDGISQHNMGRAGDSVLAGISTEKVHEDLKSGKLKLPYDVWIEEGVSWLHIDVRQSEYQGVYFFKP